MPITERLKDYLDRNHVRYMTMSHVPAFTAPEVAASTHTQGESVVKCVVVEGDGKPFLVVTNANQRVDLDRVKQTLGLHIARLEREDEFRNLFEDCEVGAMPPFGNLYRVPVVVDELVTKDREIVFNGGNHSTSVRMMFDDFERLVSPMEGVVTRH